MKLKHAVSAAFGALALGLAASTAEAAPLAGAGGIVDAPPAATGLAEKVHWWGHRRHYGHYGYYKPYYRYYDYGYYRPYRWYKPYRWHHGHRHYHY
jgi:hypothetical protein